jgi:predicted transcriptional regulator of viral defense system
MPAPLLTNHGHALLCVARSPDVRLRDIADCIGVSERAAHAIVCELEAAGYVTRHRRGRCNVYELHPEAPLRDELADGAHVGDLVGALAAPGAAARRA